MENKSELLRKYGELLQDVQRFNNDATGFTGGRSYQYLKLSTLLAEIKPTLKEHNLSLSQSIEYVPESGVQIYNCPPSKRGGATTEQPLFIAVVITWVFDDSGKLEVGRYPVAMTADAQRNGSGVTYARRYSLFAALGIYPDNDDDGAATSSNAQTYPRQAYTPQPPQDGISRDVADGLTALANEYGKDLLVVASQVKGSKVSKLRQISMSEVERIKAMITETGGGFNETA